MRIRSTKPEFWRSETIASLDWEVHYDGAMPTGPKPYVGLAPEGGLWEYVYLLFDAAGRIVYVGRSWRPADRFTKHRRKPWWSSVSSLMLVRIHGRTRREAELATKTFESAAIRELAPTGNIAGVSA